MIMMIERTIADIKRSAARYYDMKADNDTHADRCKALIEEDISTMAELLIMFEKLGILTKYNCDNYLDILSDIFYDDSVIID